MLWVASAAAVVIGITLGLLGGGGSILTVPVLTYVIGLDAKEAIATSLVVVGATAAFAGYRHARLGNVCWRTAPVFAGSGMVGAFGGGLVAQYFSGQTLLIFFGLMMLTTSVAMWRGRSEAKPGATTNRPVWHIVIEGLVVGLITGLVGAGGGFLVVPALVLMGGLSMRRAVGTSLVIIAFKSAAGFAGYAQHVSIDWTLAGVVTLGAVAGAHFGAKLADRVPAATLRRGFAVFVFAMALWMLLQELVLNA